MSRRPFRFSAAIAGRPDARALAEFARRAEALGYSALVCADHLLAQLQPLPALAAVAAATEHLRIGTYVLNNDLRHPAVLAAELATLDVLSGGRLEVGIGAGWNKPEYERSGIPFERVGVRVARLGEAVAILKGLFADGPFSFAGQHYTIATLDGQPKPVQRPRPPLLLGGGGRRVLALAGQEADAVGFAPRIGEGTLASCTFAATAEMVGWVRAAAGERFARIELGTYPAFRPTAVTDDPRRAAAELADRLNARRGAALTADALLDWPYVFIGTVESLVEKFTILRERLGLSAFMIGSDIEAFAPVVARLAGR